jgi:hypothetical protein
MAVFENWTGNFLFTVGRVGFNAGLAGPVLNLIAAFLLMLFYKWPSMFRHEIKYDPDTRC